ncbi:MAG TPA: metal-sulfur cluster assembly factor [Acidimicrobiales bacterium]|nr:metal-sulfur cluster assembly factor [Acidimicrobiales bacterium]
MTAGRDGAGVPGAVTTAPVERAREALSSVYDPELCLDVVSLGLVYSISEEDGVLAIEMTLTTPGCPAAESLPVMARAAVEAALGGSSEVRVTVVWDPPWDPSMLNMEAAAALGFRRA